MLLNYSASRITPNIVAAPTSNLDINSILGLTSSKYTGLQSVGDTGYYYGDNKMYEPYTPSPVQYGRMVMGQFSPVTGPFGTPYQPSYSPLFGYGGGLSARGGAVAGTITRGNQSFRPLDVDVTGFTKTKPEGSDIYEYAPSMAYVYSKSQPQVIAQPNTMFNYASGFTPATNNVYQQATGPMLSSPMATGSGAGRFLNTGNLLGFNFTPAQTTTTTTSNA
jgi:hypothetical protein